MEKLGRSNPYADALRALAPALPARSATPDAPWIIANAPSGSDDTTALQATLDSVPSTGGHVIVQSGTYSISNTLRITNGTHLSGMGRLGSTVIQATAAITMLESRSNDTSGATYYITIENLHFWGNSVATQGIVLGNASSLSFNNTLSSVDVSGCDSGIEWNSSAQSTWRDVSVMGNNVAGTIGIRFLVETQNVLLENVQASGFETNWLVSGAGVTAIRCTSFAEPTHSHCVYLLKLLDAHGHLFLSCNFENVLGSGCNTDALIIESSGAAAHTNDNRFIDCAWNGTQAGTTRIVLGDANATIGKTLFQNCTFTTTPGSTDIVYANSRDTTLMNCCRITGYSGGETTPPVQRGTDGGDHLVISGAQISATEVTAATVSAGDLRLNGATATQGQIQQRIISGLAHDDVAQLLNVAGTGPGTNGLVIIIDQNGYNALYFCLTGNQMCTEIFDNWSQYSPAKDTAGMTNLYYDTGNARYEIQNKTGSTQTYKLILMVDA